MKNWKQVQIPELMKNLELDKRGYPVPYIILRDAGGAPHFKINNDIKVEECIKDNKCSVCGNEMKDDTWMIGGPMSAFHPNGAYIDIPTHKVCGEYALQVCPYLAVSVYNGKQTMDEITAGNFTEDVNKQIVFLNPTQTQDRVPFFVFTKIKGYAVKRSGINRYIIPQRPYLETEFWNDGVQLTHEQMVKLAADDANKKLQAKK
jgi:hypothetical protein